MLLFDDPWLWLHYRLKLAIGPKPLTWRDPVNNLANYLSIFRLAKKLNFRQTKIMTKAGNFQNGPGRLSESSMFATYPETLLRTAFLDRDPQFDGLFVAGVISTGIFCRPTCRARKPKPEHLRFFPDSKAALLAGFRPCKICDPLELPGQTPAAIRTLLRELAAVPGQRIADSQLRQRGLEPATVRRWFQKHHGLTFQAFQRAQRLGEAFGQISRGGTVTNAAFDHGFESLSGFGQAFRQQFGIAPREITPDTKDSTAKSSMAIIVFTRIDTPLGTMVVAAVPTGLCLMEFADRRGLESELANLRQRLSATLIPGKSPLFDQLQSELAAYFGGQRREFTVPISLSGTNFQLRVWNNLKTIPYGQTVSYTQQAQRLGNGLAVRAVARANGLNRLAIIIPCHRVIGSTGALTGYRGGLWRKKWLLELEARNLW
jgi:AraC family transcriptional regulator of adaptative response/methylated-DNA-[protein]-cysteine methyltransferase